MVTWAVAIAIPSVAVFYRILVATTDEPSLVALASFNGTLSSWVGHVLFLALRSRYEHSYCQSGGCHLFLRYSVCCCWK